MLTIMKLYDHLNWANKHILQTIEVVGQQHNIQKPIQLFAHILQAEQIWLARLQGEDSKHMLIWPVGDITMCAKLVTENDANYHSYLTSLSDTNMDNVISYTNQSGKLYQTSIRDILTHAALHGQYHRGQINALLRLEGIDPVNVDFITYIRTM